MHPKSYIETTDRHDFGCKLSKWRWGRVLLWKIPEFCSVGGWVPKSGHVTITKIENLHIDTHRTIHWFHKCYSFLSTTKKKQNYRGKTVSEQWHRQALFVECLAILNWRSSSIRPSSFQLNLTTSCVSVVLLQVGSDVQWCVCTRSSAVEDWSTAWSLPGLWPHCPRQCGNVWHPPKYWQVSKHFTFSFFLLF